MGPLVWRFKTCSVITCCRQVVLLDAFAPWFSWHQRLTCRQAAVFPGSDLGASELVVSSRVPKCLHRIGSFGPPKRGSKSKASNQAAFIGLSCSNFLKPLFVHIHTATPHAFGLRRGNRTAANSCALKIKFGNHQLLACQFNQTLEPLLLAFLVK